MHTLCCIALMLACLSHAYPVVDLELFTCQASNKLQKWADTPAPMQIYTITLVHDTEPDCLDCNWCQDGAVPHIWNCNPNSPNQNQVWRVTSTNNLQNAQFGGNCLAAQGTTTGSLTVMTGCDNTPSQQFNFDAKTGLFHLGANPSLCLDAGSSSAEGFPPASITVTTCNPASQRQVWQMTLEAGLQSLALIGDPDNQCADCNGCLDGDTVHFWSCDPTNSNQVFIFASDGSVRAGVDPQVCLTTQGTDIGAEIYMSNCDSPVSADQQWSYDKSTGLLHSAANTSMCLDAGTTSNWTCDTPPLNTYPYCNQSLDSDTRAWDIVNRMSLPEKAANMGGSNPGVRRLALPHFQFNEALHGVVTGCGQPYNGNTGCPTSFPHALLLGASFNTTLWSTIGKAISDEARALHNQGIAGLAFWAPDINLFRDPRWGRGQEVPGEDPFLTGEYVMHWSRGMQEGDDTRYTKVVSTGKHFADYDLEGNWGVDRGSFNAIVNDQDQVEYYWPQWRAAVQGAHIDSIMCAYNAVNGMPSCGNYLFMNTVARGEWQFDGYIVSDCGAIGDGAFTQFIQDHYNGSTDWQVRQGVWAGCDWNCGDYYPQYLQQSVQDNVLQMTDVDQAQFRLWRAAIRLGILDKGVSYNDLGPEVVDSPEHRELALNAAQQAIVLLKNDGNLLPLKNSTKVALLGPHFNATQEMLSIYVGTNTLVNTHSPYDAIVARGVHVTGAVAGCDLSTIDESGFPAAIAAAKTADVAIVFVGLHPGQGGGDAREDEGWDRFNITLPGVQEPLIKAIVATGVPTVVVLIHGGPLAMEWTKDNVPAIVDAFYPGELGGDAIASILWGDISPAGRLPITVYPANFINERPISEMNLRAARGITYRYYQDTPLWEFGYGLSYTTFSYVWTNFSDSRQLATTDQLADAHRDYYRTRGYHANSDAAETPGVSGLPGFAVNVTNTGSVASDVSVLGFITGTLPTDPLKELFSFSRIHLIPGQTKQVIFSVPPQVVSSVDAEGREQIHPGRYTVTIGDSLSHLSGVFEITGATRTVFDYPALKAKAEREQRAMQQRRA